MAHLELSNNAKVNGLQDCTPSNVTELGTSVPSVSGCRYLFLIHPGVFTVPPSSTSDMQQGSYSTEGSSLWKRMPSIHSFIYPGYFYITSSCPLSTAQRRFRLL